MATMSQNMFSSKALLGGVLLTGGSALLFGEARMFALLLAASRIETCADFLAGLPALALALLHTCSGVILSPHGYFTFLKGVLLSFWPLMLIVAGAALLIQSQVATKRRAETYL